MTSSLATESTTGAAVPAAAHPRTAGAGRVTGAALAVVAGLGVAGQSRINGELGARLHDGIAAATISFGTGLVLLAAALLVVPAGRRGLSRVAASLRFGRTGGGSGGLRWWQCVGGACGGFLVLGQGTTVAALGVAVFTVAVVAGQSISSLAVDRLGAGPDGPQPLTTARILGAALAIVAVVIAVADRIGTPSALGLAAIPALAGMGSAWQQAVNGRVRAAAGSTLSAVFINFTVGTSVLVVVLAVDLAVRGLPTGTLPAEPWLYLGGPLGIVFIGIAAAVVQRTGVLLLSLSMISGQLIGALVLDEILPESGGRPAAKIFAGIVLTLVAIAVAARPGRRDAAP
jgi:bacterial/archaeal transporter family-2 protein